MASYRSSFVLAGAGAGLLISILVVGRGPGMEDQGAAPLQAAAADLDMKQRELAAAVEARATTLAQLPRLAWAVSTDAATVRDLTTDELGFRAQADEIIQVAQIQRATTVVTSLLTVPADTSLPAPMAEIGPHLLVSDGQMFVASVAGIEPRAHADVVGGALVVARRLDVRSTIQQLIRDGIAARLVTARGSLTLTEIPSLARQPEVTVLIGRTTSVRLVGQLPSPRTGVWIRILLGVVVLCWAMAAAFALRKAGSGVASPLERAGRAPPSSQDLPSDLPSDADSLDLLVTAEDLLGPCTDVRLQGGAVALITEVAPIDVVELNSQRVNDGKTNENAIRGVSGDLETLFDEFMDMRTRCGDRSKPPALHDFINSLEERGTKMKEAHAASDVLFQIVFIDGRAMVRARAVVAAR